MIALGNFLQAIARVIDFGLTIYFWLIIARALLTWVNPDPYNPVVRFLYNVTEPLLSAVRRRIPLVFGGLDLSPLVILAAIYFLQYFLVQTLFEYGAAIRRGAFG